MWAFAYLSVIATEVMAISAVLVALATARLTGRPLLPVVTIVVATAGALAGLWNTIALVVFLASPPGSLPTWSLPADDAAGDALNIVTWALLSLAVALVSACLWRAGVLPRLGPTVGVLAVLAVPLGPVPTALLLTVLGVTLSGLTARIRTLWNPGPRTEGSPA